MKVKFDFNFEAWIQNVEIEGDSIEDCENKLHQLTLAELLEHGAYVKDSDISDCSSKITESHYKVKAYNIKFDSYDLEDDPALEQITELDVEFDYDPDRYSIEDYIRDQIDYEIGASPESFDYKVLNEN